jgi:hypothetical protein
MKLFEKIKQSYWACDQCMKKAGGIYPEGHICTVTYGTCAICQKKDQTLIPWVDYNWPKDKSVDWVARGSRD